MSKIKYSHTEPTKHVRLIAFDDLDEIFYKDFGDTYVKYRKMWNQAANREIVPEYPLCVDVETNNFCNLRCKMCLLPTDKFPDSEKKRPKEFMDLDLFKKMIDDGKNHFMPAITFGFECEPLLHKDIATMVEYCRKSNVFDIRIGTNGMLLDKQCSMDLIEAGCTRLEVSIDALDKEVYDQIRIGGNFYKVLKNIFQFLELREKMKSRFPLLRVSFVRTTINEHQLADFIKFWKGIADYFSIQNMIDYEVMQEVHNTPVVKNLEGLKDFICGKVFQRYYMRYDGTALPCGYVFGWEDLKMGNIKTDSVKSIWDSEKFRNLRESHRSTLYMENQTCLRCASHHKTGDLDVEKIID